MEYLIVIEKGENNFSAYSPDVLGCVATGKTIEETAQRMKDALSFHLEDLYYQGEPIPQPQGLEKHINEINSNAGDLFTFIRVPTLQQWKPLRDDPVSLPHVKESQRMGMGGYLGW